MWLATMGRPDIAHSIGQVAQTASSPGSASYEALLNVLDYVNATKHFSLTYSHAAERARVQCWMRIGLESDRPQRCEGTDGGLGDGSVSLQAKRGDWSRS